MLDSIIRVDDLAKRLKQMGVNACALTDHGYMSSTIDFYNAMKAEGIKPIIGCEFYYTEDINVRDTNSRYDHLVLLAKNNIGYKNLLALSSKGFIDGFYYKPRISLDMLKQHSEGLIALSACLAGTLPRLIKEGKMGEAGDWVEKMKGMFKDFYIEIQPADNPDQQTVNQILISVAEQYDLPLVATTDAHFMNKEDYETHNVFIQISKDMDNSVYKDCWVKTEDEVREVFMKQGIPDWDIEEAINSTYVIAEQCNVEIELGKHYLPNYPIPKEYKDENDYLKYLINEGVKKRGINRFDSSKREVYYARIREEYDIITRQGFAGYFLILCDFLQECRNRNILTGDGRGSADNSLICYVLGITNVDSIKFDLDFSRFMNMGRIQLPDVDTDLPSSGRYEAINILRDKYGYDNVAQICTYQTMAGKAVIASVGKVLGLEVSLTDEIKKLIPDKVLPSDTELLAKSLNKPKMQEYQQQYPDLFKYALALEDLPKALSAHAGGVVIVPIDKDMTDFTAMCFSKDKNVITQLEMHNIEEIGLVKFDMLGIRTLDIIGSTLDLVWEDK